MKGKLKKILLVAGVIFLLGASYALYVWYKPARDVSDETAIKISAVAIFDSFTLNENNANKLYLDKAIQVTGVVSEVKKNQSGETVILLKTNDPIFGVNCTCKDDPGAIENGATIHFKGICTGFNSDVVINRGVVIKN
ncbi:MAG TPA: hypothetical protein PL045_01810 [Chitinophagaceae bacterium]|nr:hypothetical protein [Chitinophagaceae bacterium]